MPKKRQKKLREYRFKIDAYSRETMPLGRLAEYLTELAVMLGEEKSIHLIEVEDGSCVPLMLVDPEAEPKILERANAIERNEAPPDAMRAAANINEKLRKDNGKAEFVGPMGKVIDFPGREQDVPLVYGPITQPGVIIGIPRAVGGDNDPVPVHIRGPHDVTYNCWANEDIAREIARYLFTDVIRAEGRGRWTRNAQGEWVLERFTIKDFKPLSDASLRETIKELRAIPAEWKEKEDPLGELRDIRHGTDG